MKAAVLKERFPDERRVALLPENVQKLQAAGYEILIERGAGLGASIADEDYSAAGAKLIDRAEAAAADILLQVRSAGANTVNGDDDVQLMHAGQIVIGMCDPLGNAASIGVLADYGVSQVALEMIPRISRAQSMDVLSSMATIAGYRAVLHAAYELPRMFPLNMTAAGTLKATKVFIIGAGVAGLQAAATAKRLGAVVSAYDVRPDCREQVESIGARFVEVQLESDDAEDEGGYAKQQSEEFLAKQRELMAELAAESDVVITTAAIPGRQSPLLILADAVSAMKPGSVIVDLAAERGGNCELTQADETVVVHNVTILGPTNLPSEIPNHASQMFGNNITKFLLHLVNDEGEVSLDLEDEIIQGCLVSHDGQVIHERITSMLGIEIKEIDRSDVESTPAETAEAEDEDLDVDEVKVDFDDEVDADEYSHDVDEDLDADLELEEADAAEVDFDDEVDADEYSHDDDEEAEVGFGGNLEADEYSDDDFDADIELAFDAEAKEDPAGEMDSDKDSAAEDDLDTEIKFTEDLNKDDEEKQDYDFYEDSQNE
ncbi:MAG: Re/Si-specific NAD(P)(+) transhydrogenase subunit alpha [Planctomycetota bacterium]|nr:Re/Si-specific NAD(P)(+) transhydrogenase subunit alpha [Planctomycetota bacterium]